MVSSATAPEFATLTPSWELSLRADGYARNTLISYTAAVRQFGDWLAATDPTVGPGQVTRDHVRAFVVHVRTTRSSSTARSWFAGLRHFFAWAVAEDEIADDPTRGVRTPPPGEPITPVLSEADLRRLLATTAGSGLVQRRDRALLLLLVDGGLRIAEVHGLRVDDVDPRDQMVYVRGKGSRRSGPRHRAVPVGVKTAQALDRYLRDRRRHPLAATDPLWLGDRNRGAVSLAGIDAIVRRRGRQAGLDGLHAHALRHSWASSFRAAGGTEGDLMVLGGWRSRAMLDRYGKAAAADRARDAYRRLSLGDRII